MFAADAVVKKNGHERWIAYGKSWLATDYTD